MDSSIQKKVDFMTIYNRSHRLVAAIFTITNLMEENEELRTKIKKLSLELVSESVNLKDIDVTDAYKTIGKLERCSLELMSILDIASITGLISKMNGSILKEEFQSFVSDLKVFAMDFEINDSASIKNIFTEADLRVGVAVSGLPTAGVHNGAFLNGKNNNEIEQKNNPGNLNKHNNGHKRKNLRKNAIIEFIKGHNEVNIKDIASNIVGCSEKTIQRELTELIEGGKIKRVGERRWSKYSIISQG